MSEDSERTPLLQSDKETKLTQSNGVYTGLQAESSENGAKEKDDKKPTKTASFGELFQYATCMDKLLMVFGSLMSIGHGAGWPLLSIVFGDMTNDFIQGPNTTGNPNFHCNITRNFTPPNGTDFNFEEQMTKYALYYIYIGAGVFAASYIQISFWLWACEHQVLKMRKAFFRAILRQNIGWFDEHQSGELTTRLADDLERVREGIGDKFSICLQFIAQFLSGFAIAFWKGWKITLVMMSLSPLLAICAAFISRFIAAFSRREQESYANAGSVAEEVMSCIRTVISFNGQKHEIQRYSKKLEESRSMGIRKSLVLGLGMGTTMFILFGAYGLAFWFGSTQVQEYQESCGESGSSPGEVFTVFFCVMIASFSLGNAAPNISAIATAKGAAAVLLEIIYREPEIDASSPHGERLAHVNGNIEFSGVEFAYPTRPEVTVMKNLTLEVKAGQTVALVGSSGCGKSTVVNLIQRFYDPLNGSIKLDGHELKDLNIKWLRQNIGIVSQEPVLFGCSIEENISLGNPNASREEIVNAAKAANAHNFISSLPKGYETLVGERGAQLSGGQKQRVAIARALIRDPKILLLDEATSALDTESERVVQKALDKAREGRTTIVIAHRLSTIQNADMIYVMKDGEVVEIGTHSKLMELNGVYSQLVTLQTIAEQEDDEAAEEDEDTPANDTERAKSPLQRQASKQTSRQISRHLSHTSGTGKDKEEKEEEELADSEKPNFFRIFRENSPECVYIVFGCFAAFINGAIMPLFAVFFSEIVRVFGETGDKLKDDAIFWSLMFVALGGTCFIANFIQNFSFGNSGERLTFRLRQRTFQAILRQDVAYFDDAKHSSGALTTRLATDASNVKNATGARVAIIVQSFVALIAGLTIAFVFGWKLALVILAGVPIMGLAGALQMRMLKGNQKRDSDMLEEAGKTASEAIENMRTVQSLTRESHFYDSYSDLLVKPFREAVKLGHVYGLAFGFSQGVIFMIYGGAFRFGAYLITHDGMAADSVYRVFFAIAYTGISVGQASSFLPDYSKAQLSAGLIFKILDTIPSIDVYSQKGIHPETLTGDIDLQDVHFSYPARPDLTVLKGMNLSIKAGQTAALVGMSGCGKSTVVSLLQRYYDCNQGNILIDGHDVREYHLSRLRSLISVVSQEPILFDCSIRDNISYGIDRQVGMDEVIKVARTANIHDFITNLPQGYETIVGEKGTQLSGGQKQRVAIARALVRNPRILLLDEATSALDTESESMVQAALDNAQEGRTCLVIAHRLSTIQNADVIFVIQNGTVLEYGNHQELLAKKGAYATLVEGQQLNK